MSGPSSLKSYLRCLWPAGLSLGLLGLPALVHSQPDRVLPPPVTAPTTPAIVQALDLDALRAMALQKNTGIAAARASQAAAIAGQQGVEKIRVPDCLQPDLPFRRQQARLGLVAAEAGVRQAELQAVFGVHFAYVSYLFAKEQERLASGGLEKLPELIKGVRGAIKASLDDPDFSTDLKDHDALLLEGVQNFATARSAEARIGTQRALSALREAVGLECDVPLLLRHQRLLDVYVTLDKKQVIALALANRPELVQASINVQVCELEVKAQQSRRRALTVRTFASGADLHSMPLPAGRYDSEYRPAAPGAEMPPSLSGKQCDRVARASAYFDRSIAVSDRARGLITLEVEQAFLRYQEASEKIPSLIKAVRLINKAAEERLARLRKTQFREGSKAIYDDLLKYTQVSSQFRMQLNETRYQYLIALVTLERATGASFRADLAHAPEVKDDEFTKESKP